MDSPTVRKRFECKDSSVQAPSPQPPEPSAQNQAPSGLHLVPSAQRQEPSTQNHAPRTQHQEPSAKVVRFPLDDDMRLMVQAGQGDRSAYGDLYIKYFQAVKDFLASLNGHDDSELDDLAQRVFFRVWENRKNYTPQSKVKTYLFAIARHVIQEEHRQDKRRVAIRNSGISVSLIPSPEDALKGKELEASITHAKAKLTEKQRHIIEMGLSPGVNLSKAAKHIGLSDSAFRQRLVNAKRKLAGLLREYDPKRGCRSP